MNTFSSCKPAEFRPKANPVYRHHIILINSHYNSDIMSLILSVLTFIAVTSFIIFGGDSFLRGFEVYSQSTNDTSMINGSAGSQFIVNIRGITSFTESNVVALISTDNDVAAKKVDLDKALIQPGQENSFSPSKMIDVTIQMNKTVKPNSEVIACVLELRSGVQLINCNIVFSQSGNTGEPQKENCNHFRIFTY